jgi:hypothetical protein
MTKYVLNSGGARAYPELGKKYFAEIFKGLGDKPRLLICNFAQPRENWEEWFMQDEKTLPALFSEGVTPTMEMAFPAKFEEQIKNSDAIYIHGGDDHLVQFWLKKFDLPRIWEGKVVATSSASSNAVSKQFWTCDWRQCMEGIGLLPVKFLAHFESNYGDDNPRGPVDWQKGYKELEVYGDTSLPIHALKNGTFVVIEQ